MIEVVGLKKLYKTKGGNTVKALNGVDLKFPDKGMVFLLGKSGSGKSTLLNVCGGLDSPTEGEIIVKGRSSKDFTQTDFDSYRNTYIGFVFQEYNILNEFSVENNIALALELQGKAKDKESIDKLLKEVDLEGYGNRKPNTLSGGQKQRIAIARALIKNPEIIMADEPTGALDSNTGKQVLDTLKKLSQNKLVIVVSHDREFAEQYADRIIELKDGKILSDVSKVEQKQETLNENVSIVGDSVLCVNNGEELGEEDFKFIKNFLKKNKNAIICSDEHDVKNVKKVTKINSKGSKEVFENTDETQVEKKRYSKEESKFIVSRLPMKHAFTIGASGLKSKPIRLLMTILLCTFAFVLFGLLSTLMLYDGDAVFTESMMLSDYDNIKIAKQYEVTNKYYEGEMLMSDYESIQNARITDTEFNEYRELFGKDSFAAISYQAQINNISNKSGMYSYYDTNIQHLAVIDETNSLYASLIGEYPKNANEIALSSYTANSILKNGLKNIKTDKDYTLNSIQDVIGKTIQLNGGNYTVTGIFESGDIPSKFEQLKEMNEYDWGLIYEFTEELSNGIYQIAFVTKEGIKEARLNINSAWEIFDGKANIMLKHGTDGMYSVINYAKYSKNKDIVDITYFDNTNTTLDDNEIIVSSNVIYNIIEGNYQKLSSKYRNEWEYSLREKAMKLINNDSETTLSSAKKESYTKELINFANNSGLLNRTINVYDHYDSKAVEGFAEKVKIIGFFEFSYYDFAFVSDKLYNSLEDIGIKTLIKNGEPYEIIETDYVEKEGAIYDYVYLTYDRSEEKTKLLLPYLNQEEFEDKTTVYLSNALAQQIIMVNETVDELSKVFLYVGIIMAVFAALLLSNFIAASISAKTREIGILRAVGARSTDVFKIFFSESFIITVICIILSIIGGFVACGWLNNIAGDLMNVSLFVFGPLSMLILVAVALITTILATFLPVRKAAKKKPVDSIRTV